MSKSVIIDYTNWVGDRRKREIIPISMVFGSNTWHKGSDQWLLAAVDCEDPDKKTKTFAMKDIHSWEPVDADSPVSP